MVDRIDPPYPKLGDSRVALWATGTARLLPHLLEGDFRAGIAGLNLMSRVRTQMKTETLMMTKNIRTHQGVDLFKAATKKATCLALAMRRKMMFPLTVM